MKAFTSDTCINPADLGLYYLNSRFYDAEICRFLNADTIDLILTSQITLSNKNLYTYCNNNPINTLDSEGYLAISAILVKATVDATVSMVSAYLVGRASDEPVDIMEILGAGLIAGLTSASVITDIGASVWSGINTTLDTFGEGYTFGTALIAGGIAAAVSYAGFNSAISSVVPEASGSIKIVAEIGDNIITGITDAAVKVAGLRQPLRQPIPKAPIRKSGGKGKGTYVKGGKSCALI